MTEDDYYKDGKEEYTLTDILADPGAVFKAILYDKDSHNEGLYYTYSDNQLEVSKDAYDSEEGWITSDLQIRYLLKMKFRIEY